MPETLQGASWLHVATLKPRTALPPLCACPAQIRAVSAQGLCEWSLEGMAPRIPVLSRLALAWMPPRPGARTLAHSHTPPTHSGGGALCSSGGTCLRTAVGTQIPDVSGGAHWAAYRRDAGPWGEAEEPQATCLLCHQRPLIGGLKGQPGMERAGLGLASPTFPGQDRLARPCWDPGEEVAVGSRWKQFLRLGM